MSLIQVFNEAFDFVSCKYPDELTSVYDFLKIDLEQVDKRFFYAQYIHVVYCSGFKWKVVNERWPEIEAAYHEFDYNYVSRNPHSTRQNAEKIINHQAKIKAIINTAHYLREVSEEKFKQFLRDGKKNINLFTQLPYIGDITKYHLGLCLGFDVAKPDVHIQRLADYYRMDPFEMVNQLSAQTGHPVRIIDAVLWRASEQRIVHLTEDSEGSKPSE